MGSVENSIFCPGASSNVQEGDAPAAIADASSNGKAAFNSYHEPVAIVGMAMRLPGGIRTSDAFWDFLVKKRSARSRVPNDRYNVDGFFGPGKAGHVGTEFGYFLDDVDLADMDTSFWTMTRQEADVMDPQQRLALEVVHECLENAGAKDWRGKSIGCYMGCFGEDWLDMELKDDQNSNMYRMAGYSDFVISNRVSYEFDFRGPSMTIRTACSSSLTGLHEACMAITRGDCSAAVVGGTSIITAPRMTIALTEQGVISPTGSCKTFDASADGYARGEGVSALYVKKLSDAIRDGDAVRAVIRSSCVNSDGKTPGLTMPSTQGHESLMRHAYQMAGIADFSQTAMIECHGTGTKAGDPIETRAVANVFGPYGVYIGSVKPNLGHSEGNSGLSSVIKMVLALENKTIPPNINFTTPNPDIPFKEGNLIVPVEPTPWPVGKAERVGVNSFGIGGANAHVILDSASSLGLGKPSPGRARNLPALLVASAKHTKALKQCMKNFDTYALEHPGYLHHMSYTLGARRETFSHKAFSVATAGSPLSMSPIMTLGKPYNLVWTFTGQGAQWAQMGKELFDNEPVFHNSIRTLDTILAQLAESPNWRLEDELLRPKNQSRLSQAEFSQPCCTAIQIGLVDLLRYWGVEPRAVLGHSSGEIAAAYACGAINSVEAILIAYYRGQVTKGLGKVHAGGMAAVGLGRQDVSSFLQPGVVIGCENSPSSVTLTGDMDTLETVMCNIQDAFPETLVRTLRVECAYHSHHMETVADRYLSLIKDIVHAESPLVPFYSSVTGKIISTAGALGASYWVQNLLSPVLFYPAVRQALSTLPSPTCFVEIGPHSALAGPIRQAFRAFDDSLVDYVPTLVRSSNAAVDMLNMAGNLWLRNTEIDFTLLNRESELLSDLPSYPWHYEAKHWAESRISKSWRMRNFKRHDILGDRVLQSTDLNPSWRNILRLDDVPWIRDHEIAGDVLFPAASFIAMAGQAIFQLSGIDDYTVRRVNITTALVVQEGKPIELVTSFRPVQLTTSLQSCWYDFDVTSLNGSTWVKHITGQIRAGREFEHTQSAIEPLERQVSTSGWYRVMKRFGLAYGPRFRLLKDVTTGVDDTKAVATIENGNFEERETSYALHPAALDASFQLLMVAAFKGISRRFDTLSVPTYVEELYVRPPNGVVRMQGEAARNARGLFGSLSGVSNGETVISLKNLQLSPLVHSEEIVGDDPHAAIEQRWDRDLNFLDLSTLMFARDITQEHMLLEKFALACMIESSVQLERLQTDIWYMNKFRAWLAAQRETACTGDYPNVAESGDLATMSSQDRRQLICELYDQLSKTGAKDVTIAVHRIFSSVAGIFEGTVNALDVLLNNDVLTGVYNYMQLWEYGELFRLLGHTKPNLKILEIGAGTGGTTSTIIPHMTSSYGERLYGTYTYTDISAGFFVTAKNRFHDVAGMEYAVLDISKDPIAQGFKAESFDLIIACNVLHATPSLHDTLTNVRKLLHPRGRLLLQELSPTTKWINYVMGPLAGWWLGEADGRVDEPYVTPDRWDQELKAAGFGGITTVKFDGHLNNNIIAMPSCDKHKTKRITILVPEPSSPHVIDIVNLLNQRGYETDYCAPLEIPRPGQMVLSLLDMGEPFFHNLTSERFTWFQSILDCIKESGMLWITAACQIMCKDPRYSQTLGFARTIRSELQIDFATLELDSLVDAAAWAVIPDVLHEFEHRVHEDEMNPVMEYAYDSGAIQVGKFHWISVNELLQEEQDTTRARQLDIERPGALQTLFWQQVRSLPEVAEDWVEIEPRAVGLNFKDVLIAMNIVPGPDRMNGEGGLGCECSGVVTKVGPNVVGLKIGDPVVSIAAGSFATKLTTREHLCTKMPDGLSFSEGATIPCVYGTAIYSLIDVARLEKGQTILIHSAAGGVGIAAIQVAKMIGAEVGFQVENTYFSMVANREQIYCTVGTSEKAGFLTQHFGIHRDRIFNSRDTSFVPDIMAATKGRGVDVALNSLSGELLHATWRCIAKFGIMVEIGKRDFLGRAHLAMDVFEQNRSFQGVDLTEVCTQRPVLMNSLLQRAIRYYEQGHIKPISPIKQFDATQVEDAFRFMQKGQHIGKIVITLPQAKQMPLLRVKTERRELTFRQDRAYLIVGGLGGLGRSVASWMVERGAAHIIFFSRSAGAVPKDDPYLRELEAQGCAVQTFSGSVAKAGDVARVIRAAGRPIAGVLQASLVLSDASINEMTFEQWQAAIQPKVQGTWNLHKILLCQKEPLDFFFLFSSLSGLAGQPGQANYASANAFLDAFVQYRHAQGLPASVLDIGAMDDVGYLSKNAGILEALRATTLHVLHEQDLLDSLELMILRSRPQLSTVGTPFGYVSGSQVGIGFRSSIPLSARNNRTIWKRDPRMAIYRNIEPQAVVANIVSGDNVLKHFLSEASSNPGTLQSAESISFLAKQIGETLFGFMMRDLGSLDLKAPLSSLGVDSLVSIELRNWLRQNIGAEFTVLEVAGSENLLDLGGKTVAKLGERYATAAV